MGQFLENAVVVDSESTSESASRWEGKAECVAPQPLPPSTRVKTWSLQGPLRLCPLRLFCAFVICVICGSAAQKPKHTGIKLEGYATAVTPNSITVFDKKNQEVQVQTDRDYTSLVGIAAPVTVWYKAEGGVNHLEDIVYPQSGSFVPADSLRTSIKRIIILPYPEGVDNSEGLIAAISTYLSDNAGWFVAPPELALEIASRTNGAGSPLDAVDPNTGAVDMSRYLAAQGSLVMAIAAESHSDAVLEVRVVEVKANVRSSVASWDDMTEPVASRKSRVLSPLEPLVGSGWVYAATADMSLWSQTGKLLWKKRRGFAVLAVQSGISGKYRERPLTEVYPDRVAMDWWLRGTFGQLAPPVKPSAGDAPGVSPKTQK